MKQFIILLACLTFSSCSSTQNLSRDNSKLTNDNISDILQDSFMKNGANIFCDQGAYTQCFQITTSECVEELSPFINECFADSNEKYGELKVRKNEKKHAEYFSKCMLLKHLSIHADDIEQIGVCLKNVKFDTNRMKESLLK